jgi:hypothetical protein
MFQLPNNNKGSLLVELVIVIGIIVGVLGAILGLATFSLLSSSTVQQTAQATILAEETMEALRNYRDGVPWTQDDMGIEYDGLGTLDFSTGSFHLEKSTDTPAKWQMVSDAETVGIFERKIDFMRLERDGNDDIVVSGSEDSESVQATVTVTWQERGRAHEVHIVGYLTNWQQL